MGNASTGRLLAVIIALHALAGGLYSVSTPLFDVSDEVRHFAVIDHLARGQGLPVQDPANHGFYEQEGSQPPLYYAAAAVLAQAFDITDFRQVAQFNPHGRLGRADATDNRNQMLLTEADAFPWRGTALFAHVLRLIGVLFGCATVLATFLATGELARATTMPLPASTALLGAALVAFNPMYVFITASVNNDVLVTALGSLALWVGLHALRVGLSVRSSLALGALIGGAALAKSSGLALAAVLPAALVLAEWRRRGHPWRVAACALLICAIAGWFYLRNQLLYGDITGIQTMAAIAGRRDVYATALDLLGEWDGFFKAYWGLFGAVNIPMAPPIYTALEALLIACGAGLLLHVRDATRTADPPAHALVPLATFATVLVAVAALARWSSLTLASQGRLLFPTIAAISGLSAIGFARLVGCIPRMRRGALFAVGAGLAALTFAVPFAYIQPAYALPPRLAAEAQLPPGVQRTELRFGDAIRWIGYQADPDQALRAPGDALGVTMYWQATRPITANYSAFLKLVDRAGVEVAVSDITPGGGLWQTSRWNAGEIIVDHYRLVISDSATTPGVLRLDAGFYTFADKANLPTFDGNGAPTGRQRYEVAGVSAPGRDTGMDPAARVLGHFGLGAAHPAAITAAGLRATRNGDDLRVTIEWATDTPFEQDYTIFAQLLDDQSRLVAQADGRAQDGAYSTRWWQPGVRVSDTRAFVLPKGTPADTQFTLLFGLYRAGDFARLPATAPDGARAADDALRARIP